MGHSTPSEAATKVSQYARPHTRSHAPPNMLVWFPHTKKRGIDGGGGGVQAPTICPSGPGSQGSAMPHVGACVHACVCATEIHSKHGHAHVCATRGYWGTQLNPQHTRNPRIGSIPIVHVDHVGLEGIPTGSWALINTNPQLVEPPHLLRKVQDAASGVRYSWVGTSLGAQAPVWGLRGRGRPWTQGLGLSASKRMWAIRAVYQHPLDNCSVSLGGPPASKH